MQGLDPLSDQRRLAKAGWGRDEGQLAMQGRVQPLSQARTWHQFGPWRRDIQFGLQGQRVHFWRPWCCEGKLYTLIILWITVTGKLLRVGVFEVEQWGDSPKRDPTDAR
jgi:hypothetical protein